MFIFQLFILINMDIYILFPYISYILSYICLLIYLGVSTTSKRSNYNISYNMNFLLPLIIIITLTLSIIEYDFGDQILMAGNLSFKSHMNQVALILNIAFIIALINYKTYSVSYKLNNFEHNILLLSIQLVILMMLYLENFILIYLALETVVIGIYLLVSINRLNTYNIEIGIKYFIIGATSSGLFLMGLSLIYGTTGVITLSDLNLYTNSLSNQLLLINSLSEVYIFVAVLFLSISLIFKVYGAPLHLWVSDVYQGVPTGSLFYVSTVPSLIYFILLYKFTYITNVGQFYLPYLLLASGLLSIILGSLGALLQRKLKRLLAYSSVTHVGYFLICLSLYISYSTVGLFIFFFFYAIYILHSAALITTIQQMITKSKHYDFRGLIQLNDYKSFFYQNSILSFLITMVLFSLLGLPPFFTFFCKVFILLFFFQYNYAWFIILIFIITSVISGFYYLFVIKNIYYNKKSYYYYINYSFCSILILTIIVQLMLVFYNYLNVYSVFIYSIIL